jgi:hypothetical protein
MLGIVAHAMHGCSAIAHFFKAYIAVCILFAFLISPISSWDWDNVFLPAQEQDIEYCNWDSVNQK